MSESVTSEDFQALIAELKKTNKQLSQQEKGGLVGGIKKKIEDVKDSVTSPFKRIKETIAAPGKFIGDAVEDIGDAVMSPFKSFKNVSEGFKNIFSKNETERQTELLEQILQGIEDLNQNVSVNTNREQNQDLIKLEQGKEQRTIFRSISDNIKNAGVSAGGRGSRRKGKGGASGGGDRGFFANMAQDFFLAAIVTQRGIGEFVSDIKKNLVDTFKSVAKPFKMVFGGVKKLGRGAINLAKDVFGKDEGQKGIPFRRAAVKEKVSSVVSSVKDKAKGLKERFFPNIPEQIEAQAAPGEFDTSTALRTGEPKSLQLESVSENFRQRNNRAGGERILNDANQQELFSEGIVESNYAIVEAVKENTSSLVKVLTGNDLKKAETEKERDKTFQDIADSLEDIEGSGLGKGTENKKGEGLISEIIDEYGGKLLGGAATIFGGKKLLATKLGKGLVDKGKGLFSRLNPFSGSKAATGAPSPRVTQPTLTGPAQTIRNAGQAGADASSRTIRNITNAPGSSVVGAPKPKGGFLSRLNPMNKIKDATKGIANQFPSVLKKVPVIGGVVEGIFLNSAIKTILEDPEASEDEKKKAVGTEFIKALTGPAGAAIAIGAVTAATGGVGFLASAVTGTAGYAIGKVVGSVLASVLPTKTIGGAIINTFYKKESAQGQAKPQTTTQNPVKVALEEAKLSGIDMTSSDIGGIDMTSSGISGIDMTSPDMGVVEKGLNTTGVEMLGTMRTSSDASADINTRMIENRNVSSNTSVVNAPTNSNITTINEAPNHIDRTTSMFGGQLAY